MTIVFRGPSPHDLGKVEVGYAKSVNGNVELMQVLDDWHNPAMATVRINIAPSIARTLARELTAAALEAESSVSQ